MATTLYSATPSGIAAKIIEIQVVISPGLPATLIVGLPDAAIRESRERIRGCFRSSRHCAYPPGRIVVNLAPAHVPKYGTQFDFAIAAGILAESSQAPGKLLPAIFIGELSLDGSIRPVFGCLAMAAEAKDRGYRCAFVPQENYREALMIGGIAVVPLRSMDDFLLFLSGRWLPLPIEKPLLFQQTFRGRDFAEIHGQEFAKRGLEIVAAGGHNMLMAGSPGGGKTLLAEALPSILPPMTPAEMIETASIYGSSGLLSAGQESVPFPFRNPHPGVTQQAFTGGGNHPRPGEMTLAHNGILFLDELPEFSRAVIETLRQPLESGVVKVGRVNMHAAFPARFIFIAAQNPCPCGYRGDPSRQCSCSAQEIQRYERRVSGPIHDRIDIHMRIRKTELLPDPAIEESSAEVRKRVIAAREIQIRRNPRGTVNARLSAKEAVAVAACAAPAKKVLFQAQSAYDFSARTYFKILKIARTIADLGAAETVDESHIAEALRYRMPS